MNIDGLALELEQAPLLDSLSEGEMSFLLPHLQKRSFHRGGVLMAKGTLSDGLYLITSGLVGVSLSDDPAVDEDVASLSSGECVGEMSLMSGEPCSATIHALVDTETLCIARTDFPRVLDRCPTLWRNLTNILSRRLVKTNRRIAEQHQARLSALFLLTDPATAGALAFALTASLAAQTGRRVLMLDLAGRTESLDCAGVARGGATPFGESASTLEQTEAPLSAAFSLRLAALHADRGSASAAADELRLLERLKGEYDEVVLVLHDAGASDSGPWLAHAGSALYVATEERASEAFAAAGRADSGSRRADFVVLIELPVISDNQVGGLWDGSIVSRHKALSKKAGALSARSTLRFLPLDRALLDAVRARGYTPLSETIEEPAHQAIARLARRLGAVEVGLALGAGMAKGFAHIGVLKVFREYGVPLDYIAGSSIGAIVGSTYAGGMPLEQLQGLMTGADKRFVRPTLPFRSISSNRGLKKILTTCHERAPTAEFAELFIPFAALATDVMAAQEVVLRDGVVWSSVLASISMPGIFPPVVADGRVLVDGGLVNPVPGTTLREMGADIAIAVDLASSGRAVLTPEGTAARVPNIIEMLWRTMEIMLAEITSRSAAGADVTIRPNTGHSHIRDFSHRGPEFIAAGEQAAREALPEIAALLPSVRLPAAS